MVVRVDRYIGVRPGRNGPHELFEGTLLRVDEADNEGLIDTENVFVSMNVQDARDRHGLPYEIPLSEGDELEIQGIFIPLAKADAYTQKGDAGVIHFSHAPCGYVTIDGQKFD
jgi:hypothetical protein